MAFTPKQRRIIEMTVNGESAHAICKKVHVARETVRDFLLLDDVRKEVRKRQETRLRSLSGHAISAIQELLGASQPPAVRLKAAIEVLDRAGFSQQEPSAAFSLTLNLGDAPEGLVIEGRPAGSERQSIPIDESDPVDPASLPAEPS